MPEGSEIQEQDLLDPGQNEGVAKPAEELEKKHEPGPDHPRFTEVYGQMKDGQRTIEDLNVRIGDTEKTIRDFQEVNEGLVNTIETFTKQNEQSSDAVKVEEYNTAIKDLREARTAAFESSDFKEASKVTDQIETLTESKHAAELEAQKVSNPGLTKADLDAAVASAIGETTKDNTTKTLKSLAPWFNQDSDDYDAAMASAAIAIDASVATDPDFMGLPVNDQMAEVKRRTEERFHYETPADTGTREPLRKGPGGVGGVNTGGSDAPTGETITLTAEEAHVARNMFAGNPDAELIYAKQKALMNKGGQ